MITLLYTTGYCVVVGGVLFLLFFLFLYLFFFVFVSFDFFSSSSSSSSSPSLSPSSTVSSSSPSSYSSSSSSSSSSALVLVLVVGFVLSQGSCIHTLNVQCESMWNVLKWNILNTYMAIKRVHWLYQTFGYTTHNNRYYRINRLKGLH